MDEISEKNNDIKEPDSNEKITNSSKSKEDEAKTNISDETPKNTSKSAKVNITPFTYFSQDENVSKMSMNGIEIENIYGSKKGNYKYVICVLLKDDSDYSSLLLERTLEGIKNNLGSLAEICIKSYDILICVFVNYITSNKLIDQKNLNLLHNDTEYLNVHKIFTSQNQLNINIICKNDYLNEVASLKFFYCGIINQLRPENKIIFTSIISSGVVPKNECLIKLIQLSYNSNKEDSRLIAVPAIERFEDGLISKIKKYERVHFNLYNMNFYDSIAAVPVSSQLNTMTIGNNLAQKLELYYQKIHENATIDYHDYNLALYFFKNKIIIRYYQKEILAQIIQNINLSYFKDIWVNRYSGYYGNFFDILNTLISKNGSVSNKIFNFFQLVGICMEFIYPSFSIMVIYIGLQEGLNTDFRIATFFTLLYLVILLAGGACSLTTQYSQKLEYVNYFFSFFMEIFYLFFLCTSITAIDNINKRKTDSFYIFDKGFCASLIILTFIIGILPILIKVTSISKNILPMLLYLILGASSTSSIFQIAKILNASDTIGGKQMDDRKGVYILIFFLFNLFFGSLTFCNYNTEKRANCLIGLSIFYLIYLLFKIIAIIINILSSNKNKDIDKSVNPYIRSELDRKNNYEEQFNKNNELVNSSARLQDENYYVENTQKKIYTNGNDNNESENNEKDYDNHNDSQNYNEKNDNNNHEKKTDDGTVNNNENNEDDGLNIIQNNENEENDIKNENDENSNELDSNNI